MNDLLFYALLIALLYYFFIYLPNQKKLPLTSPSPTMNTQATQTETIIRAEEPGFVKNSQELEKLKKDNQQKEKTIIGLNNSYQKLETNKNKQIDELQTQIRELVKRPLKPTNSKSIQTSDSELTDTLDTLIKNIQELNKEIE